MSQINFFFEYPGFSLENENRIRDWLKSVALNEGFEIQALSYVFLTDENLKSLNDKHLNHNYYTDILTFDLSDIDKMIEADIFISVDRVRENAQTEKVNFNEELMRVIVHGLLHLLGYDDKSDQDKLQMRAEENKRLALLCK